jgi:hypothetical protein
MEDFEEEALKWADYKPMYWCWYVENTFVVWPHGPEKLDNFSNHLNSIHQNL